MGKHSKKNHNPNWRAEQSALTEQSRLVRLHGPQVTRLKFSDRTMQRLPNGQLVRVNAMAN